MVFFKYVNILRPIYAMRYTYMYAFFGFFLLVWNASVTSHTHASVRLSGTVTTRPHVPSIALGLDRHTHLAPVLSFHHLAFIFWRFLGYLSAMSPGTYVFKRGEFFHMIRPAVSYTFQMGLWSN